MAKVVIELTVNGCKESFTQEELSAIVAKSRTHNFGKEVERPKQGVCFKVRPSTINRMLFDEKREHPDEEKVRLWIKDALFEMDKNPSKYERDFFSLIPKRQWGDKSVEEVLNYATTIGGVTMDWIEAGIEISQRISNGENWHRVCRELDDIKQNRIIIWKNGCPRFIGGSNAAPAEICEVDLTAEHTLHDTVPKVVIR